VAASRYVVEIACIHLVVAQCSGFTMKWSIEKTIAGGFGCALAVLVLISLLSYQALHNFTEAARRTTQTHGVLTKLEEILSTMKDAETGRRGYILTGEESYLEPYYATLSQIDGHLQRLKELTTDNPIQQQQIPVLTRAIAAKLNTLREGIALKEHGDDLARQPLLTRRGKEEMDTIRSLIAGMQNEERELLRRREEAWKTSSANMLLVHSLLILLTFAILFSVYFLIRRDLSGRKRAVESLQESEERFRQVAAMTGEWIWEQDLSGRYIYSSSVVKDILGYTLEEVLGKHYSDLFTREQRESVAAGFPGSADSKDRFFRLMNRYRHKDGHEIITESTGEPVLDAQGELIKWRGVDRDITERKKAEEELNRFFTVTPDMLCIAGFDGYFKRLNLAWERTLGFTIEELLAEPYVNFIHPDDREATNAEAQRITMGAITHAFENRYRCKDGSYKWMLWTASPSGQLIYAAARDITERKKAEKMLAENAAYDQTHGRALILFNSTYDREKLLNDVLSLLAENHPFPVSALYTYDEWTGSFCCNAHWGTPSGYTQEFKLGEGLIGQAAQANRMLVLEDLDQDTGLTLEGGILSFRPAALLISPISHQERCLGMLVLAASQRLSPRDRAFIERLCIQLGVALHNLKQYNDLKVLAAQLRQRSEEIMRKNAQLEEANRMKSEFLANMSHELRTPLMPSSVFRKCSRMGWWAS
jgi:PAS domain S-box-containing protein